MECGDEYKSPTSLKLLVNDPVVFHTSLCVPAPSLHPRVSNRSGSETKHCQNPRGLPGSEFWFSRAPASHSGLNYPRLNCDGTWLVQDIDTFSLATRGNWTLHDANRPLVVAAPEAECKWIRLVSWQAHKPASGSGAKTQCRNPGNCSWLPGSFVGPCIDVYLLVFSSTSGKHFSLPCPGGIQETDWSCLWCKIFQETDWSCLWCKI